MYTEYITTHSLLEVESTDHAIGELWESSLSSLQRRGAWKGEQLREPEWELVTGVGAQGRREPTEGVVGLLHGAELKEKNLEDFKEASPH